MRSSNFSLLVSLFSICEQPLVAFKEIVMNSRMWSVVRQEVVENLRRRSYLLLTFGVPVLAVVLVVGITWFRGGEPAEASDSIADLPGQPVGYVDQSGLLGQPGPFSGSLIAYGSEAAARADVEAGNIAGYYLVPENYLATGQVTRYATQINVAESDMALFEAFLLNALLAQEDPLVAARLQSPAVIVEHQVDSGGAEVTARQGSGMDLFWLVYVFGMLMMLTTFLTAGQLMQSVIKEKENRVIEIVLSSVRPLQLMAGKLAGQGLMGLLQMVTWLSAIFLIIRLADVEVPFLRFLSAAEVPASLLVAALLYFLLGFALYGTFSAAIGAISANMREGPQYAMIYSMPAAIAIIFLPSIAEAPNSTLAIILSFFPLTAPIAMIERMVVTAVPGWQLGLSLALLALSVLGGLWLAARLFRVNTLLSGQLPGRKQLVQLLVRG
jgi:ABC-2 type transport system permease protein